MYVTTVTLKIRSERPLTDQRVEDWLRPVFDTAVSLHETPAHPGDPTAPESGWEYVYPAELTVARSEATR